ncbi:hypothetical protein BGZ83_000325 [Gryganskiella cystojenkinii]|nr:hypothetical protein BGZ83_000325 [Gryganskiella cystojenkinii]
MSSTPRPVHRVLTIPMLVESIAQHLRPHHVAAAVQASKDFYEAFLPLRWQTLDSGGSDYAIHEGDSTDYSHLGPVAPLGAFFPHRPLQETEHALIEFGIQHTRHVAIRVSEDDRLLELLETHMETTATATTAGHGSVVAVGFKSVCLLGSRRNREFTVHRMHWDEPIDDHDYGYFDPKETDNSLDHRQGSLSLARVSLALTLAETSLLSLRRLQLEGFKNISEQGRLPFVTRLNSLLDRLENLEVLHIGRMPMMDVVSVVLQAPSTVRDLSLAVWYNHPSQYAPVVSTAAFEQEWIEYQNKLLRQSYRNDDNDDDEDFRQECDHNLSPTPLPPLSSLPTVQSLLVNMAIKPRLTQLSLFNICVYHPIWILFEILRHCPNLSSFKIPDIPQEHREEFLLLLRDHATGKYGYALQHLNLTRYHPGWACQTTTTMLDKIFKSATASSPRHHRQEGSSDSSNNIIVATTSESTLPVVEAIKSRVQSLSGMGLQSLNAYNAIAATTEMIPFWTALKRISITQSRGWVTKDLLRYLEQCPELESLILMDPCLTKDEPVFFGHYLRPNTYIDLVTFLKSGSDTISSIATTPTTSKTSPSNITGSISNNNCNTPIIGYSPHQINSWSLDETRTWPCSRTLRCLSIRFRIQITNIPKSDVRLYFMQFYQKLGSLQALEDLAVGAKECWIDYDPWEHKVHQVQQQQEQQHEDEDDDVDDENGTSDNRDDKHDQVDNDNEVPMITAKTITWTPISSRRLFPDFSLKQGLGHMSNLKRLRRLNLLQLPRTRSRTLSQNEILWMSSHWPSLESFPGLTIDTSGWSSEDVARIRKHCAFWLQKN